MIACAGTDGVETIDANGTDEKTPARGDAYGPVAWSPNGTEIASLGAHSRVWTVNSDGTGKRSAHD